jgi:hypothetical protein
MAKRPVQHVPAYPKAVEVEPPQYPLRAPEKSFRLPGTMAPARRPDYTRMERPTGVVRDYAQAPEGDWYRGSQNQAPLRGEVIATKPIVAPPSPMRLR